MHIVHLLEYIGGHARVILFGIEVDQAYESLLADQTELWFLVGAHAAVLETSPHAF
jgi:hypothetical protein